MGTNYRSPFGFGSCYRDIGGNWHEVDLAGHDTIVCWQLAGYLSMMVKWDCLLLA